MIRKTNVVKEKLFTFDCNNMQLMINIINVMMKVLLLKMGNGHEPTQKAADLIYQRKSYLTGLTILLWLGVGAK